MEPQRISSKELFNEKPKTDKSSDAVNEA